MLILREQATLTGNHGSSQTEVWPDYDASLACTCYLPETDGHSRVSEWSRVLKSIPTGYGKVADRVHLSRHWPMGWVYEKTTGLNIPSTLRGSRCDPWRWPLSPGHRRGSEVTVVHIFILSLSSRAPAANQMHTRAEVWKILMQACLFKKKKNKIKERGKMAKF